MASEFGSFDYSKIERLPEVAVRVDLLRRALKETVRAPSASIMEIGVGSGDITVMLAAEYPHARCVDADSKNCRFVSERLRREGLPALEFVCSRAEDLAVPDASLDHVIFSGIIEHLEDPVRVLGRIARFLRPEGCIHIITNLANSIHRWLGVAMGIITHPEELSDSDTRLGHFRVYTEALLSEHIRAAGLEVVHRHPFYLKPLPTSMLTPLPPELHEGLDALGTQFPEFASYIYVRAQRQNAH